MMRVWIVMLNIRFLRKAHTGMMVVVNFRAGGLEVFFLATIMICWVND